MAFNVAEVEVEWWLAEDTHLLSSEVLSKNLEEHQEVALDWQTKYAWVGPEKLKTCKFPVSYVKLLPGDCLIIPPRLMYQYSCSKVSSINHLTFQGEGILLHWNTLPLFTMTHSFNTIHRNFTYMISEPLNVTHSIFFGLKNRVSLIEVTMNFH